MPIFNIVTRPIAGYITDRWHCRKQVFLGASLLNAFITPLIHFTPDFTDYRYAENLDIMMHWKFWIFFTTIIARMLLWMVGDVLQDTICLEMLGIHCRYYNIVTAYHILISIFLYYKAKLQDIMVIGLKLKISTHSRWQQKELWKTTGLGSDWLGNFYTIGRRVCGLVQRWRRTQKLLASVFDRYDIPYLSFYCCISAWRKLNKMSMNHTNI